MAASSVMFAGMSALIKHAANLGVDPFKTALFRFAIGLAILCTAAMAGKIRLAFHRKGLLFLRGLLGGLSVFIFYVSISVPQLGIIKGTLINYTYPIFATIGGALFLRERVGPGKCAAILCAFGGIYLIASGGSDGIGGLGWYDLLAIGGAVTAGVAVVLIKKLHETESSYSIYFAQCAMGFWLMVVPSNMVACRIGVTGGVVLLGIGLAAAAAQLMMTYAFKHVPVSTGSVLGMLTPVINLPVGLFVFGEAVTTGGLAGAGLILAACVYVGLRRS